jgi:SPP1 gp7 family putative phage head morphogenesis protein
MEPTYKSAFNGVGNTRMYVGTDGNIYEYSDGDRAWRNNNPGNIENGSFARNNGAIGSDGRFAIFPDSNTGWNAMVGLLSNDAYQKLTIEGAINRYAPPNENNVETYLKFIENQIGFPRITPMNNLSKDNLLKLAKAMQAHEGNKPGKKRLVPKNEKYMWITEGDDRVRPEHEALDGEVRSWYDSPHPGEDFGCRCHAEAVD